MNFIYFPNCSSLCVKKNWIKPWNFNIFPRYNDASDLYTMLLNWLILLTWLQSPHVLPVEPNKLKKKRLCIFCCQIDEILYLFWKREFLICNFISTNMNIFWPEKLTKGSLNGLKCLWRSLRWVSDKEGAKLFCYCKKGNIHSRSV